MSCIAKPFTLSKQHRIAVDRLRELAFVLRDAKYGSFPDHQFVLDMTGFTSDKVGVLAEAGAMFGSKFTRLRKGQSSYDHAKAATLSNAQSFFRLSWPQTRRLFTSDTEDSVLPSHTERFTLAKHLFSFITDVETGREELL